MTRTSGPDPTFQESYTLPETHAGSSFKQETNTNQGQVIRTSESSSDTSSMLKTGSTLLGDYVLNAFDSQSQTETNQTQSVDAHFDLTRFTTKSQTGNALTGAYVLGSDRRDDVFGTNVVRRAGATDTQDQGQYDSAALTQWGNELTGDFNLTQTSRTGTTLVRTVTDPVGSFTVIDAESAVGTVHGAGNALTGTPGGHGPISRCGCGSCIPYGRGH